MRSLAVFVILLTQVCLGAPEDWTKVDGRAEFRTLQPTTVALFDGRDDVTRGGRELASSEIALLREELAKRASLPVLVRRLGQLHPTLEDFEVRDWCDGSFTRAGARQRATLYRYSHTNGLVVTENQEVVAHYSGDPGDYALFLACHRAPDLNGDGLDEIALVGGSQDTPDLDAHVFSLRPFGATHLGGCPVFTRTTDPGDGPGVGEVQDTAYRAVAAGSALFRQRYVRYAEGPWRAQGTREAFQLEDPARYLLPSIGPQRR